MGKDLLLPKGLELIDINFVHTYVYSKLFSNDMGHSGMIWNILGPRAIRNTFLAPAGRFSANKNFSRRDTLVFD